MKKEISIMISHDATNQEMLNLVFPQASRDYNLIITNKEWLNSFYMEYKREVLDGRTN